MDKVKINSVFVDMDGVTVDLISGIKKLFGWPDEWYPKQYFIEDEWGIPFHDFVATIQAAGEDFWCDLKPIPEGVEMVRRFLEKTEHVVMLSSPLCGAQSASGKIKWLNEYIPEIKDKYIITVQKSYISGVGRLLIDDWGKNILSWCDKGIGIFLKSTYSDEYENKIHALTYKEIEKIIDEDIEYGGDV